MKSLSMKFVVLLLVVFFFNTYETLAQQWVARHDMSPAAYQSNFTNWSGKGYRLKAVSGYTRNGKELYTALWVKTSGPAMAARHGMSANAYQDAFNNFAKQGYRLTWISAYSVGNSPKFAAIWEKKGGPAWAAKHNMTSAQYQQSVDDFIKKGYRVQQVCGYDVKNQAYFAAIWEKSSGPWAAKHNLTAAQYQSAFNDFSSKGFVLRNVSGYEIGKKDYYAAVWDKEKSPLWSARHGISADNYQHVFDNKYYQGYVPVYLNAFASGRSNNFNVIWENTAMKGSDMQDIDNAAEGYMKSQNVKGLSLAVCKDGKLVYAKSYGFANPSTGEELSPNHSMRIMSISKPITACGIMKLYEQDNSLLGKKVFGPGSILGSKFPTPKGQEKLNNILVRQLLWHTSGLRTCNGEPVFWDASKTADDAIKTLLNMGDLRLTDTSTQYNYSNANYFILARIIEKISGMSYENFIRSRILAPSGIGNTMYVGNANGSSRSNEVVYDPSKKMNLQLWGGFGGWVARPMDLLKFLRRVDGDNTPPDILTKQAHDIMTTGSMQRSSYAFGWNVSGNIQNHNGCFDGTRSFLVELSGGISYAVIINDNPTNDACGWTMKSEIEKGLSKVSKWPNHDLF